MSKIIDINKAIEYDDVPDLNHLFERGLIPTQQEQITAAIKGLVEMAKTTENHWRNICVSPKCDVMLAKTDILKEIQKLTTKLYKENVQLSMMFCALSGYNPFEEKEE